MKRLLLLAALFVMFASTLQAQSGSVFFGASGVKGTSAFNSSNGLPQAGGGTFLNGGGELVFWKHFGVEGEVAWRAHQNSYGGFQPFRPIFYDVNGLYAPTLGKYAALDLMAGIGAESTRFYTGQFTCTFNGCTNYTSSNHFMGHFGAGLRIFVHGGFFVRPEAHVYLVNNNFEFSGGKLYRAGASIGYTFGER